MRSEQPCRWARASRTYNTSSLGRLITLRLDLLQVGVHLRITRDDSLDNLLDDAVLVLFDRLLDIGQLGLGRGVDRGLRGGFVGRVLGVSYWRRRWARTAPSRLRFMCCESQQAQCGFARVKGCFRGASRAVGFRQSRTRHVVKPLTSLSYFLNSSSFFALYASISLAASLRASLSFCTRSAISTARTFRPRCAEPIRRDFDRARVGSRKTLQSPPIPHARSSTRDQPRPKRVESRNSH